MSNATNGKLEPGTGLQIFAKSTWKITAVKPERILTIQQTP